MNLLQCGDACRATKAAARRQKLVGVARRLFAEQGFHSTGVAQLAAESGIRVGQIYRDFADKEAIVAEIVESDLATFLNEADLDRAIAAQDPCAIRHWLRVFSRCEGATDSRALVPEIIAEAARNDRIAGIAHAINRRVRAALGRAILALAPEPEQAAERARLADLILTIGAGLMHRRIADADFDEDATRRRLLEFIDEAVERLIRTGPYPILQKKDCSPAVCD
ncbi:TetR/AcrR family transcriptional regulator [Sphingomonas sp. VNH70]|uniref:TetR/AcrR family transcriptional regulator n=1 Tax=Sphingomonas silueang TaxID=3156617 RepID=UPI0032B4422D